MCVLPLLFIATIGASIGCRTKQTSPPRPSPPHLVPHHRGRRNLNGKLSLYDERRRQTVRPTVRQSVDRPIIFSSSVRNIIHCLLQSSSSPPPPPSLSPPPAVWATGGRLQSGPTALNEFRRKGDVDVLRNTVPRFIDRLTAIVEKDFPENSSRTATTRRDYHVILN